MLHEDSISKSALRHSASMTRQCSHEAASTHSSHCVHSTLTEQVDHVVRLLDVTWQPLQRVCLVNTAPSIKMACAQMGSEAVEGRCGGRCCNCCTAIQTPQICVHCWLCRCCVLCRGSLSRSMQAVWKWSWM